MNGLVKVEVVNGKPCVTSLQVADAFEKEHKNVLADIRNTVSKCSESFTGLNFQLSEYTDSTGRKLPMYILTKDGFMMLAMGYTTPEAMRVKEAYIAKFNEMEEELRHPRYQSNSLIDAHVRAAVAILSCAGLEGNQLALAAERESGSPHQAALLTLKRLFGFTPAGRMSRDTLCYPRRGYSFMGKTKAPATLTVPGLSAIS